MFAPIALAQSDAEKLPTPKEYEPVAGKSVLFLYRNDVAWAPFKPITMYVNGRSVGNLVGATYARLVIPPGKYTIGATAVGGSSNLAFDAESAKVQFIWVDAQISLIASPKPVLVPVDGSQGKADLDRCGCSRAEGVVTDPDALGLSGGEKGGNVRERLQSLKQLFDDGLITKDEYDAKRKAILEGL